MQTMIPGGAGKVFDVINGNRAYLKMRLPRTDGTDSAEAMETVIVSGEKERESGTDLVLGI